MYNTEEAKALTTLFEAWAVNHLGQGYSLEREEHTYIDKVTRWAFVAYKAGRKEASVRTPKAWYDKAVGGFYLSEDSIPDSVVKRGGIVALYE